MSTFFDDEVNCSCCGGKVKVTCIGSTNSFGGCDLDTRPAPMQRWTMGYWIQACPHCGYVNSDLEEYIPGVESIINSKEYIECDGLQVEAELAKYFIRWGLICSKQNNLKEEVFAYLHAAWVCDDSNEREAAVLLRKKCETLLIRFMEEDESDDLKLIDADLLRRSGQFAEVIKRYSDADKCASKQIVVDGLRFEVEKAKDEDMNRYKFAGNGKFETV